MATDGWKQYHMPWCNTRKPWWGVWPPTCSCGADPPPRKLQVKSTGTGCGVDAVYGLALQNSDLLKERDEARELLRQLLIAYGSKVPEPDTGKPFDFCEVAYRKAKIRLEEWGE